MARRRRASTTSRDPGFSTTSDIINAAYSVRRPSHSRSRAGSTVSVQKVAKKWYKKLPELNFITIHYIYIISMTLLGACIIYAVGNMPFIDALFFSAGSSTQSGLNTIDLNTLYLYQQIIMMIWACLTTPVFINTAVVFVRLYWFSKRFKHLVERARENQKSWAKSRTKSEAKRESDLDKAEKGVAGRDITVLHHTTQPNGMSGHSADKLKEDLAALHEVKGINATVESSDSSTSDPKPNNLQDDAPEVAAPATTDVSASSQDAAAPVATPDTHTSAILDDDHLAPDEVISPVHHRAITFPEHMPAPHHDAHLADHDHETSADARHIAIVRRQHEAQRAQGGTLRIPGPRDFERGEGPEEIPTAIPSAYRRRGTGDSGHDVHHIRRMLSNTSDRRRGSGESGADVGRIRRMLSRTSDDGKLNADDHPVRRGITINEPAERPKRTVAEDATNDGAVSEPFSHAKNALMRIITPLFHGHGHGHGRASSEHDNRSFISRTITGLSNNFGGRTSEETAPYLSYAATIGRNSAFIGLSEEQREELGGIEYRSLKLLAKILVAYFVGFHVFGMIIYLPWILYTEPWKDIVLSDGIDPGWWGVFTAASMFNDLGLTLTPDSMLSFQTATLILLIGSFLIIIGNTGFPVMLRFIIWVMSAFSIRDSPVWEELRFLLDHPRRCFTLLFPARANWILFGILVALNGIDLVLFIILDIGDPVVGALPPGFSVLNGWFQAASTRTAGFSSVNIAGLRPAIQVSYMIMMYISVLPIAMSVRNTNVYEEASLGLYGKEDDIDMNDKGFIGQHLRRQLSFDLWYVFLGYFLIAIIEGDRLAAMDDPAFSLFAVLFEIVSAYGTVGLSLGYPTINASFSAELHTLSKLIIAAMMIRGRHRGLPYALDRAVLLPSEERFIRESEEAARRFGRRSSINDGLPRRETWSGMDEQEIGTIDGVDPRPSTQANDPRFGSRLSRRMSNVSGVSNMSRREGVRQRGKNIAQFLAGGLGAGPTISKYD